MQSVFEEDRPGRGRNHLLNKWLRQSDKFIRRHELVAADGCVFPETYADTSVGFDPTYVCEVSFESPVFHLQDHH